MSGKPGISYWIDDLWREEVEREMKARDWDNKDLAEAANVGQSTISELLSGAAPGSKWLPRIHAALGWPPPRSPVAPPNTRKLEAIIDKQSPETQEALLSLVSTALTTLKKRT
jgi:transcriptional regulator with XRE-family HTH domain